MTLDELEIERLALLRKMQDEQAQGSTRRQRVREPKNGPLLAAYVTYLHAELERYESDQSRHRACSRATIRGYTSDPRTVCTGRGSDRESTGGLTDA